MAATLCCGCRTPYQSMGFTGGYRDQQIGPNEYEITVKVNGFTDRGTALEYLHRRADELCPAGYDIMDRAAGDNGSILHDTHKAEEDAVVRCRSEKPAKTARPPSEDEETGERNVVSGPRPLFCMTEPTGNGACFFDNDLCEQLLAKYPNGTPCIRQDAGACFSYTVTLTEKRLTSCAPTIATCEKTLAIDRDNPDMRKLSKRCAIYRVKADADSASE